jgi:predicted amidohydrolase YtcJ
MAARAHESTAVFVNADVVTMDPRHPFAEAVAVRSGRILAVGEVGRVLAAAGPGARLIDLGGHTLVPGFIDGHGHFTQVASELDWVDLSPPPAGHTATIEGMIAQLRARLHRLAAQHKYVLGVGYDDAMIEERRHPTKEDLDRVSTDLPVWAVHTSRHMAVGNSVALDQAGIAAATPDPGAVSSGGRGPGPGGPGAGGIARRPGSLEPTGLLRDAAWAHVRLTLFPTVPEHHHPDLIRRTGDHYARLGITTAIDGSSDVGALQMLHAAADDGSLSIDVVSYPLYQLDQRLPPAAAAYRRGYVGGVRIGGLKIVLDGEPQGKSAWLTRPYLSAPEGEPPSYAGVPLFSNDDVYRMVADCFSRSVQVLAHANGDAAIEQMIEAVARAERRHGRDDRRPVIVHAQLANEEQLDRMQVLGIVPSFCSSHCFYWGDFHVDSTLGQDRACRISPARSAGRRGIPFTLHNDAPVVTPNILFLIWSAVTRLSRSGDVVGPEQRLTPTEALRAVTIDAAHQHFEDERKGSLEVGKLADMAVLSANPLRIPPEEIREIEVLATLKEGMPIHVRERAQLPDALAATAGDLA